MPDVEDIRLLLNKSIEQLYIELGQQLLSPEYRAFPFPKERYMQRAREWLLENRERLRQIICDHDRVKSFMNSSRLEERVLLISAIVDLISSMCSGISPVTVAVLLVKEGLNSLCVNEDKV